MNEIKQAVSPNIPSKTVASPLNKKSNKTVKDLVVAMQGEIAKALPKTITPDRFTRITLSALSANPKLQACTPTSFLSAMMQSAQLGLEPNTPLGQAYLIPYKNKNVDEVQFQIGYKGLLTLAHNAGVNVSACVVHENDEFNYELGLNPKLDHKPTMVSKGKAIAYYAVWRTENAFGFEVMSIDDVKEFAKKYSKNYSSSYSPWSTNFDEMAKKTVIKKALKYAPLSTELQLNLTADETVKHGISNDMTEVTNDIDWGEAIDVEPTSEDVKFNEETGEIVDE